jgi:ELWxxDGT repeat protein
MKSPRRSSLPAPSRAAPRRRGTASLRIEVLEDRLTPSNSSGVFLVDDIREGAAGSNPAALTDVNGTLYFTASDAAHGTELWRSDGTAAGTLLVKDINPGSGSSYPTDLTHVNGTLFFRTGDGSALWKTDGTPGGTVLVINDLFVEKLTNVNGTLFFVGYDAAQGAEIWKSDGTAAGTVLVKDINPGTDANGNPNSSSPYQLKNVNGTLFFDANDGVHGWELWKSDGTAAGTVLVKDINPAVFPGGGSAAPYDLTNVNGTLFFRADDGTNGWSLWKSDGTAARTVLVSAAAQNPWQFANVNGTLFFGAYDATSDSPGVWKSDGTAAGTVFLKSGVSPTRITDVNGTAFFTGYNSRYGSELWKSDGTTRGTVLVKDIYGGTTTTWYYNYGGGYGGYPRKKKYKITRPNSSDPDNLVNANGTLFFVATDEAGGRELWKSNGTAAGTVRVKDIMPGSGSSAPTSLTVSGGHLFFAASDAEHGRELWDPVVAPPESLTADAILFNPVFALPSNDNITTNAQHESAAPRPTLPPTSAELRPGPMIAIAPVLIGSSVLEQDDPLVCATVFLWRPDLKIDTRPTGASSEASPAT